MNDVILQRIQNIQRISKRKNEKTFYGKSLLIITFIALIIIISTAFVIRVVINKKDVAIPTSTTTIGLLESSRLNTSEKEVLVMLLSIAERLGKVKQNSKTYSVFLDTLKNYLCNTDFNLSASAAQMIEEKIDNLYKIINYEKTSDMNQMSLDGRRVMIYLYERIYELCDLKITFNMDNEIESVSDLQGNDIYTNDIRTEPVRLHIGAIIITLSGIIALTGICYVVSKKNQLFVKEVIYDGIDAERYA